MSIQLLVVNGEIGLFNILLNMVIQMIVFVPSTSFSIIPQVTVQINLPPKSLKNLSNVVVQKSFNPTSQKSVKRNRAVLALHWSILVPTFTEIISFNTFYNMDLKSFGIKFRFMFVNIWFLFVGVGMVNALLSKSNDCGLPRNQQIGRDVAINEGSFGHNFLRNKLWILD